MAIGDQDCYNFMRFLSVLLPSSILETVRRDFGTNQRPMGLTPVTGYLIIYIENLTVSKIYKLGKAPHLSDAIGCVL